ncbi:MAG: HEAT repeat domain-containing protein [Gemmatimonadaceae bacterium]|nr:HEAT repeat domain-containing protein [Gemmatimonadaceae bacterium]
MPESLLSQFSALSGADSSMLLLLAKATIILVAALGITLAMQRASAGARHLVWLVTLGTLVLVPAVAAWAPLRVGILPATSLEEADRSVVATIAASRELPVPPVQPGTPNTASPTTVPVPSNSASEPLGFFDDMSGISILVAIWAAVVLCIGGSLAYASVAVRRIVRHGRPLESEDWLTPLWEISDRLGLDEPPRLLRSDDAKMPFACGVFSPTVVLPAESDGWTPDRRRAVLLHELAHVRRHDLAGHTLGRLVCAVYWFHPLVWTAAKRLRSESERACDDLALACGARATDYAEHLLDIVTSVRRDSTPSVALAMARRKEFEGRMLAILDPELRRSSPSRGQTMGLMGSLAVIAILVSAAAPVPRSGNYVPDAVASSADSDSIVEDTSPDIAAGIDAPVQLNGNSAAETMRESVNDPGTGIAADITAGAAAQSDAQPRDISIAGGPVVATVVNGVARIVAKEVLSALGGVFKSGQGQGAAARADDRPILLARVLRTDTSENLRRVAAWGLSEYAETQVGAEALAFALRRDASATVREMAAWALADGDDGNPTINEALGAALRGDANVNVRATAAWALGNVGERQSADVLTAALGDASPEVRRRAAWALGQVEPKEAPRPLLAMLSDADPRNRELAAWVLFQIEDPGSIPALEAALARESNKDLQLDYIRALAAVGEHSVDAIRKLLESPDAKIKSMAVRALAGGNATGPWPWPWPQPRPFP